jgi:periplasmic copper chaperone A
MGNSQRVVMLLLFAGLLTGCPLPEKQAGEVSVEQVEVRMAPAGASTAAVYFTLRNSTQLADTLKRISSPAGTISLHSTMLHDNGVVMMTPLPRVAIPASTTLLFKVGERHGMLEQLSSPLHVNDSVSLTFEFARRKSILMTVRVQAVGAEE